MWQFIHQKISLTLLTSCIHLNNKYDLCSASSDSSPAVSHSFRYPVNLYGTDWQHQQSRYGNGNYDDDDDDGDDYESDDDKDRDNDDDGDDYESDDDNHDDSDEEEEEEEENHDCDNDSIIWYVLHTYTVDFYASIYWSHNS